MPSRRRSGWCSTGKRRLSSESAAILALLQVQAQRIAQGAERIESRAYLCPHCRGWHLTSMTPKTDERPR